MPENLRRELLALNLSGDDELARAALAANALARLYGQAVAALLQDAGLKADAVTAIGAHGQTVRHRPDSGYTVQLNAPALLAELTGIDVVADFRSRDVAAGGQAWPSRPQSGRHRQRHAAGARPAGARLRYRPGQRLPGRLVPTPSGAALCRRDRRSVG
ncbi:hypothetical protein G6F23_014429 [Rhizopus arrhizus]|nr:hypothetical protein G6F23_014429 [Rhizopus arrhizus]